MIRVLRAPAVAALLAGVVYLNALHNPYVYDDYSTIVTNTSIQDVSNLRAIALHDVKRPIVNLSYAVDRAMWGPTPFGFHLTNVLLHMVNVVLLFALAFVVVETLPATAAFSAAALFAVHPMMTEAVGYISGRSELLCAAFFLLALLCGRRWLRGDGVTWGVSTIVCWAAALASKETAAMFPFVLLAYDRLVLGGRAWGGRASVQTSVQTSVRTTRPVPNKPVPDFVPNKPVPDFRRRLTRIHAPLVAITIAAGIGRLLILSLVEYPGRVAIHGRYVLLDLEIVRRYVGLMLDPRGQTIFHSVAPIDSVTDLRLLAAIATIGLLLTLAWTLRRAEAAASFGLIWFLLILVPSSVLVALDQGEPIAEHRVYLASCGLFLTAGAAVARLAHWLSHAQRAIRVFGRAAFVAVLVSLSALTWLRNRVWSNPVALMRESVDLAPAHPRPRLLLGEALQDAGRRAEAIEEYQTAIRLRPGDAMAHLKLGRCLAEMGRFREARPHLLEALRLDPGNALARQSLVILDEWESRLAPDAARR